MEEPSRNAVEAIGNSTIVLTIEWNGARLLRCARSLRFQFALSVFAFLATLPSQAAILTAGQFEVVSIKAHSGVNDGSVVKTLAGGTFIATNVTLKKLAESAFGVHDFQITGEPRWANEQSYDVTAKTSDGKDLDDADLQPLLQSMLEDRFQLKSHHAVKHLPVYYLVVAKGGSKVTPHAGTGAPSGRTLVSNGKATMTASAVPLAAFAENLGRVVERTVLDRTHLTGLYDFKLEWAPDLKADSDGPSIFAALQQQLGLKLQLAKGPVDVVVIDSAQRASEN